MKIELTIPSSMDEITLGQYQEFIKSQENNTDELFISQKLVSIFCQIPLSQKKWVSCLNKNTNLKTLSS